MLAEMNLPYAYDHFVEGESPDPPFLVFLYPGSNHFAADGKVYFKVNRLNIEFYTDKKDVELEETVEAVLQQDIKEQNALEEKRRMEQMPKGSVLKQLEWATENLYEVLYQMEV